MKMRKINPGRKLRLRLHPSQIVRLLSFADFDPASGCWNFRGHRDADGYGEIKVNGKKRAAHRVSYAVFVRSIPDERDIDHRCRNRACFNPHHLICRTISANRADHPARS